MKKVIEIDKRKIGENNPVYIVAEMSANHNGDYNRAVEIPGITIVRSRSFMRQKKQEQMR